jgi:phage-related protein
MRVIPAIQSNLIYIIYAIFLDVSEQLQIHWMGDAKQVLREFPHEIKSLLGYSLRRIQRGLLPDCDARRMESIGKGVWELKAADERAWYRVLYLTRIGNNLYVIHVFEKDSRKTGKRDIEVAKNRFKLIKAHLKNTE